MLIGELMFLSSNTVPTIPHSVHAHARYMTNATHAHLDSAKTILRYLIGFVNSGRKLRWCAADVLPPTDPGRIFAFADSSWADVEPSRKSTYGYYLFVNNAAFAWKAALAPICLALSTAEAELIAICASDPADTSWVTKVSVVNRTLSFSGQQDFGPLRSARTRSSERGGV
jgi:hypothetical protein